MNATPLVGEVRGPEVPVQLVQGAVPNGKLAAALPGVQSVDVELPPAEVGAELVLPGRAQKLDLPAPRPNLEQKFEELKNRSW